MVIALGGTVLGWRSERWPVQQLPPGRGAGQRGAGPLDPSRTEPRSRRRALALALVLLSALRAKPVALGGRSFSAIAPRRSARSPSWSCARARRPRPGRARRRVRASVALVFFRPRHVRRGRGVRATPAPWPPPPGARDRGRSVSLRLAALSLARHPATQPSQPPFSSQRRLAVFAESYRSTLARGQQEQARSPSARLHAAGGPHAVIRVREAAPPEQLEKLGARIRSSRAAALRQRQPRGRTHGDRRARPRP